jgi:AhpD family alkylhydroperoxidase
MAENEMAEIRQLLPDMANGFSGLFMKVMKEGALSLREKELVALGISLAVRCEPCIEAHVEKCLKAGASREQILEAASVAVVMSGGPAFTNLPKVLAAIKGTEK